MSGHLCTLFSFLSVWIAVTTAELYPPITDPTATGYRAYIEEYRHDLQHEDYRPKQQDGNTFYNLLQQNSELSPQSPHCIQSLQQGVVEFADFGPLNDLPFDDMFVVSPGHLDVTGKTHFAFLDAYGARLKDGELEVLVSENDEKGKAAGWGFHTKSGRRVNSLSMHYEAAAMGYGRGDSQALAPPLRLRAVSKAEVARELAVLSSTKTNCYCDLLIQSKVSYVMGLIYYPQYGHTIFNGLSNMVATLWRKQIPYEDVEFSPYLFRNTSTTVSGVPSTQYQLQWFEMYQELFRFYSTDITLWVHFMDYSQLTNKTICFPRIMVGALPHLDLMNITSPSEMWGRFSRGIISSLYWSDLLSQQLQMGTASEVPDDFSPHTVSTEQLNAISPAQYPDYHLPMSDEFYDDTAIPSWKASTVSPYCAVTIVTRDIHNARSIVNAHELVEAAAVKGCQVQMISLEKYSLQDQIGQVRWNTTLLVSVDGSALLNTLFMHECSTVMYVELWRRALMIPKFEPAIWTGYTPVASDTSFVNKSDSIAVHLAAIINEYKISGRLAELESLNLDILPFPNKLIEDFLRNQQATTVRKDVFVRVLADSIQHNRRCRRRLWSRRQPLPSTRSDTTVTTTDRDKSKEKEGTRMVMKMHKKDSQ